MRLSRVSTCGNTARHRLGIRFRDERGIALVMALGIMLVLTITLTTVITFTAAGSRDSHRVNAGQKATALADAGVNNALAVLTQNYPGIVIYPGDPNLLPARTTGYSSGSVTWSGVLEAAPATVSWNDQWRITSVGTVTNPTGPGAAPIRRTTTAIVPIVIPETVAVDPGSSSLNWIYSFNDVHFAQSVTVRSPVYAKRDLYVEQTATIGETIPPNATQPVATKNKVAVGRDLWLLNPQNKIGHVFGTASPANSLDSVYVQGKCSSKNITPQHFPCSWGAGDDVWAVTTGTVIPPGYVTEPKLTCCAPYLGSIGPAEPVTVPPTPSVMGFWYRNALLGPNSLCATSSGTPPRFDKPTGTRRSRWFDQPERDRWTACLRHHRRYIHMQVGSGRVVIQRHDEEADDQRPDLHRRQRDEQRQRRDVRREGRAHPLRHVHHGQPGQALREVDRRRGLRQDRELGS